MFKRLKKFISKKQAKYEPVIFGFIATLRGEDDLGDRVPTQIFVIPSEEETKMYDAVKSDEYSTITLLDNNRIQFKPPYKSTLLMTPFFSVEEIDEALRTMRDQGIKNVIGWNIPID
jgi:hypothetical protein|nr:MAG TPA: hypothetical protein [Caudoviricetes sp.]